MSATSLHLHSVRNAGVQEKEQPEAKRPRIRNLKTRNTKDLL